MKRLQKIILLLIIPVLFNRCGTASNFNNYLQEVRYSLGTIHNIDRNIVTLTDGSQFKLRRFLIAVNMSPVILILPSYSDESFSSYDYGYMFIDGTRYEIVDFSSVQFNFFRYGFYEYAEDINYKKGIISVTDGSKWQVLKKYFSELKLWVKGVDILLDKDNQLIFNLRKLTHVEAVKITTKKKKNKSKKIEKK